MPQTNLVQQIRLAKLTKSPDNVRRTPPSQAEHDQLKADIAARGLLQPLVVRPGVRKGHFEVVAGGRRLEVLEALHKEGKLPKTYAALCMVRPDTNKEESLAENLQRANMHPADEFTAFAELIDEGADVQGIAERFGVAPKDVRQRLKLGKAAPELIQAYRDKEMDLDTLMAFTVSEDHDAQCAVWEQVKDQHHVSTYAVKQRLTEGAVPADSRLGRFVGIKAYEQAGGAVTRDLFTEAEDGYLTDAKLVRELAFQKLAEAAKALEKDWQWVKPMLELDYHFQADYTRVHPAPIDPPKRVAQELKRIEKRLGEFEALEDDDWTDELAEEAEKLEDRRGELMVECFAFTPEDMARAGCIVTVGRDGDLEVHAGLLPREDATGSDSDAVPIDESATDSNPDGGDLAPIAAEKAPKRPVVSKALAEDLKAYRLQMAKAHLAGHFDVAFDAMLYSLCMCVLRGGYFGNPLSVPASPTRMDSSLNDLGETPASALLDDRRATLATSWMNLEPAEAFEAMSALSGEEKQALFAWSVAQCLEPAFDAEERPDSVIERIGARLDIDAAAHWRPTADNYWGRVKMDHGLEVGGEILGSRWRRDFAKAKKATLAKALERVCDPTTQDHQALPEDARKKAANWTPPGFAFAPQPALSLVPTAMATEGVTDTAA